MCSNMVEYLLHAFPGDYDCAPNRQNPEGVVDVPPTQSGLAVFGGVPKGVVGVDRRYSNQNLSDLLVSLTTGCFSASSAI